MKAVKELHWEVVSCGSGIKERINFQCGLWTYHDEEDVNKVLKSFKINLKEKGWEIEEEGKTWFRAKNNNSYAVFEIINFNENACTYIDLY